MVTLSEAISIFGNEGFSEEYKTLLRDRGEGFIETICSEAGCGENPRLEAEVIEGW